jgi:hypothetical protein
VTAASQGDFSSKESAQQHRSFYPASLKKYMLDRLALPLVTQHSHLAECVHTCRIHPEAHARSSVAHTALETNRAVGGVSQLPGEIPHAVPGFVLCGRRDAVRVPIDAYVKRSIIAVRSQHPGNGVRVRRSGNIDPDTGDF